MSNQAQNPKYDLIERTAKFGEQTIKFAQSLTINYVNKPLISQVVRAGTSIGANYMEADACDSKKDFIYKISLCKKESKETMHWMRMIGTANEARKAECRVLYKEAHELCLIFSTIIRNSKKKS